MFVRSAVRQGFRPILLAGDPRRYDYAGQEGGEVINVDTQNKSAILDVCHRIGSGNSVLSGVTSSSEYFIETAATIACELGLPGPLPHAVSRCRDKSLQKDCLKRSSVRVPEFRSTSSTEEAAAAAVHIGFPVVLKPVCGSGSIGVRLCMDECEVVSQAEYLLAQRTNERGIPIPCRILIEEYVIGKEYSVEVFGGRVIGITRKHLGYLPNFVEIGHDYPGEASKKEEAMMSTEVSSALQALGLCWGPAHCEVRISRGRAVIIEINPRLAGGYIPELVRLAHGIDIVEETIKSVVGLASNPEKVLDEHASIRFIIPEIGGRLIAVEGLYGAEVLPGVAEARIYKQLGEIVHRNGDFRDRIGHVIATGKTATAAQCTVAKAHGLVRLTVAPTYHYPQ
jgi:S-sulfo-L-cysteine synthase (3-phospho-L-serine-dependent)